MKELDKRIDAWAEGVGIHDGSTPLKQALYTLSETQELLVAVEEAGFDYTWGRDTAEMAGTLTPVQDAIGDIYVTLKNVAHFFGLTMEECVEMAVTTIEDRAKRGGGMVDGVYVKPEEA